MQLLPDERFYDFRKGRGNRYDFESRQIELRVDVLLAPHALSYNENFLYTFHFSGEVYSEIESFASLDNRSANGLQSLNVQIDEVSN